MATINFSSSNIKYVLRNFTKNKIDQAAGYGAVKGVALAEATNVAKNAVLNGSWDTLSLGQGTSRIGRYKADANISVTSTSYTWLDSSNEWKCTITYKGTQTGILYLSHIKFAIPNVGSYTNIKSASLKITNTSTANFSCCVCAPNNNTTISDNYYDFNNNNLYYGSSFNINNNTTITVNILEHFKKCIQHNLGVLIITPYYTAPDYSTAYLSGLGYEITYELNTTACGAPTSISDNGTGFLIPNGTIKLNWSGATAGTNNAIAGYRIYWSTDPDFILGSADGYYDFLSTNTSCSFNTATNGSMPSVRGNTYYFKICTKGSVLVNNAYYSAISSARCPIVFNNLPDPPSINSYTPTRVKSVGTSDITFSVTPGDTRNIGQEGEVWYYTSTNSTKKRLGNGKISLSSTDNTVYFLTYDGYEYSNTSISLSVAVNVAPTCSITSLTISNSNDNYYNPYISAKSTLETCYTGGSITKSWEIISNGISTLVNDNNIINYHLLSNNGVTFGSSCIIKYIVTDDVGETASAQETYVFPSVPTYSFTSGVNNTDFGTNLGIDFSIPNSSPLQSANISALTLQLNYKLQTDSDWNENRIINITKDSTTTGIVNCSSIERGTYCYLRIIFKLNNNKSASVEYKINNNTVLMRRAPDIKPEEGTILTITPFTPSVATFNFKCAEIVNLDLLAYREIKFKFSTNELTPSSVLYSISDGTITALIYYNTITSLNWQTFIGNQNQLNKIYTDKIYVSVTDLCGDIFSNEFNISYDFSNSLDASGILSGSLYIKDAVGNYQQLNLPKYPLFLSQTLRIYISNLKSYCSEKITFDLEDTFGRKFPTNYIELNVEETSGTHPTYISNNNFIDFVIPKIENNYSTTYFRLKAYNEGGTPRTLVVNIYNDSLTELVKICRCDTTAIDFIITKIESIKINNNDGYRFYYAVNDFGGAGNTPYKENYDKIEVEFYYTKNGLYNSNLHFTLTNIINNTNYVDIILPEPLTDEKVYFKTAIKVTNDFISVNSQVPYGTDNYIRPYTDSQEFTFYNTVPNLAYGKNFFLFNTTDISSSVEEDCVLVIRPIGYTKNNLTITRNKIYFGAQGEESYIEIGNNSLIINGLTIDEGTIDGIIINGGTWDS